jgi:hypothetical protein
MFVSHVMREAHAQVTRESISVVTSFVFNSCDFVDRLFCPEN